MSSLFILNVTMLSVVVLNVVAPSTKLLGRRQNKLGSIMAAVVAELIKHLNWEENLEFVEHEGQRERK
jgi:hypothetical protein